MEDDIKYDGGNLSKTEYLQSMEGAFDFLKSENVNQLEVINISCSGCNAGLTGFGFFSSVLRVYCSFILEIEDNKLTDLIECSRFEVTSNGNDNIKRYLRLLVKPEVSKRIIMICLFEGVQNANYLIQRIGALNDTAKAIDLTEINTVVNLKLLKQLKKELNEILRFSKSNIFKMSPIFGSN
jgi:hypothetical protein